MTRLSISELTTYRWPFEEDVRHYQEAGIDAIGVWRHKLSDFGEERAVELIHDSGLKVSSLLWAGGFTGSEGRSYRESIGDACDALRLAQALDTHCLILHSGGRAGHTHNHARRLLKNAISEIRPLAEEFGITLALEPMAAESAGQWTFLTDLDDTVALVQEIDSPRVKLVFDTYHFGHLEPLVERLEEYVPLIEIVHLADARTPPDVEQNRCPLGEGVVPLEHIINKLISADFPGYFEVELMGEEIEAADYEDLISHSREAFERYTLGSSL